MIPTYENLARIALADLQSLVTDQVSESTVLDFKLEPWPGGNGSKEWCKDISALANTDGGAIVLGVREEDSVAVEVAGCQGEVDDLKRRLRQSAEMNITPRISLEMREFRIANGRWVMVIATPRSRYGPHMSRADGDRRLYKRTETSTEIMDVDELRRAFIAHRSVQEVALERHRERARSAERRPDALTFVLDFFPVPLDVERIDPARVRMHRAVEGLSPLLVSSHDFRIGFDGYVLTGGAQNQSQTEFRRTGEIYMRAVHADRLQGERRIASVWVARVLRQTVDAVERVYARNEIADPYLVCFTVKGALGRTLTEHGGEAIAQDLLEFPPVLVETHGGEPLNALSSWMHRLWNAAGMERCNFYTADDQLIPTMLR